MKYTDRRSKRGKGTIIVASIAVSLLVLLVIGAAGVQYWYRQQLNPVSNSQTAVTVTIPTGATVKQIAKILESKELIKSAQAFEWYIRNKDLRDSLQAGQYQIAPSQSVQEIATILSQGKVQKNFFTILPAQRLDQIKASLIKAGYNEADVTAALDPAQYKNHPALVAKPNNASLEGYLYPETFQTTANTTPKEIITQSLDEMANVLTPDLIEEFQDQDLSIHEAITLASIVEQEVSNGDDRRMVAQVFLNRLKIGMMLGSDVTYRYAAILTGQEPSPFIDSPYNTRKYKGLPPGPISNVSQSSLLAVARPAANDYLFFVAGDDGKTYYSKTAAEHEALAAEHCKVLCSTY